MSKLSIFLFIYALTRILGQIRNVPNYEIEALQDLFNSTNGEYWVFNEKEPEYTMWNFQSTANPCYEQWQGVTCINSTTDEQVAYVYELVLPEYNLTGTIPKSINNFSSMFHLDLSSNSIDGAIPNELESLQSLFHLDLSDNFLSGCVPLSLYLLPEIAYIHLQFNNLEGSISPTVGLASSLWVLQLNNNLLTGSIPTELANCTAMAGLSLFNNFLNGTIPHELGALTLLNILVVDNNYLTGSIPNELFNFCNPAMIAFSVSDNQLTGTLPYTLNNCTNLQYLFVSNNLLHGSIPNYTFPIILYLYLDHNHFMGTIPTAFNHRLAELDVSHNQLHGSIPEFVFNGGLRVLYLNNNQLSGSIVSDAGSVILDIDFSSNLLTGGLSSTLFAFTNMRYVNFSYNYLEGNIPENIIESIGLTSLSLNNNLLTGVIPKSISNLTLLEAFVVSYNELTGDAPYFNEVAIKGCDVSNNGLDGSLPVELLSNSHLGFLNAGGNFLTGSIPSQGLSSMLSLTVFNVNNNLLSGSLPSEFSQLTSLQLLFLDSNMLTGDLGSMFDNTIQTVLRYVDVSDNQIHGTIPTSPFLISSLISFAAVSNCLYGTLPAADICALVNLTTLAMDGLESAKVCQHLYFPNAPYIYDSYGIAQKGVQGLDKCLFNMERLETLHLSGNAISGSIPTDVVVSDSLQDLSLSHNSLTGTIPLSIQLRPWMNLDLSYNKLGGGLSHSMPEVANNASVSLEVNRLSGDIPHSLKNAKTIDMLDGNLFKCDTDRRQLPVHDKYSDIYECGSNTFNYSLYVWLSFSFLVVCVLMYTWRQAIQDTNWLMKPYKLLNSWLSIFTYKEDRDFADENFLSFAQFVDSIRVTLGIVTIFILVVLMPIYIALSFESNTYAYEYAWTVSAAYLSGLTPAIVLIVCFTVLGVLSLSALLKFVSFNRLASTPGVLAECQLGLLCSFIAVVIANIVLVLAVNIGYVYVHVSYDATIVHFAQFALAMFKLLWNNWAVRELLKLTKQFDGVNNELSSLLSSRQSKFGRQRVGLEVLMILFNNLGAPFIATALVSTNCFYNIIAAPPKVEVSYTYAACVSSNYLLNGTTCLSYDNAQVVSTSYSPPFLYSYECASTFITTYSTIYIFMFIIVSFLSPVGLYLLTVSHQRTSESSCFHSLIDSFMPKILKLVVSINKDDERNTNTTEEFIKFQCEPVFHCDLFVVKVINIFAMIVTFGAVLPPLAVVGFVAVFSFTLYTQLLIGRYVMKAADGPDRNRVIESMNRDCEHASDMFMNAVWIVLPFAMVFYAILLLDTLGDAVGWKKALWAPVVTVAVPTVLWMMWRANKLIRKLNNFKNEQMVEREIVTENSDSLTEKLTRHVENPMTSVVVNNVDKL